MRRSSIYGVPFSINWTTTVAPFLKPQEQWAVSDRLCVLDHMMSYFHYPQEDFIQSLLTRLASVVWNGKDVWRCRYNDAGETPMHLLAKIHKVYECYDFNTDGLKLMKTLRECLIRATRDRADLHELSHARMSPSAQGWLKTLTEAGVDLLQYGAQEAALWRVPQSREARSQRMLGFTYGRRPEDWTLLWEQSGDAYAGIFWDMVEHPERQMPGAWQIDGSDGAGRDDDYFAGYFTEREWREYIGLFVHKRGINLDTWRPRQAIRVFQMKRRKDMRVSRTAMKRHWPNGN